MFWVLAGDVYAPDFVFSAEAVQRFMASDDLAHLWLVPNPPHNPLGDFGLDASGRVSNQAEERWTYSTIGLYRRALFQAPWCDIPEGNPDGAAAPLAPLLRAAISKRRVSGELFAGAWTDVGTPGKARRVERPNPWQGSPTLRISTLMRQIDWNRMAKRRFLRRSVWVGKYPWKKRPQKSRLSAAI